MKRSVNVKTSYMGSPSVASKELAGSAVKAAHRDGASRGARVMALLAAGTLAVSLLTGCSLGSSDDTAAIADNPVQTVESSAGMELLTAGSYQDAAETFEAQVKGGTDLENGYRGLGIAYMGLGEYEKAAGALEKALEEAGVIPTAMEYDINYYLGSCYYKLGRYEDALTVYDAIVSLQGSDADAYVMRGTVYAALGNTEKMNEDFSHAIALEPSNYDRIITIYQTMEQNGLAEEGKEYLRDTLTSRGDTMDMFNLGRLNYYCGEYETAKEALENVQDQNYNVTNFLGRTYEALGDYNYATGVYQAYLEKDTSHAEVYNQLGLCQIRTGDYENALVSFQTGEKIEGNEIMQSLKLNEIITYERLGDFARAQVLMKEYIQKYPGDAKAQREYTFLQTR